MNEQHIARLESHLERLVEGTFISLFGKKITAHDLALELARSMDNTLRDPIGNDPRLIAPDQYQISLNVEVHAQLLHSQPDLSGSLGKHIVELVNQCGYRMLQSPIINLVANAEYDIGKIRVEANYADDTDNQTAAMTPIRESSEENLPIKPRLIINGERQVPLKERLVNIGRSDDTHIVIDDPYLSRHHIQLRMRFGSYILFDIPNKGGTRVNNIPVREHRLQSGDVIHIGHTQIIYTEDESLDKRDPKTTDTIDPVSF